MGFPMSGNDPISATVYGELRKIAAIHLRREQTGHTLQPTALVHEAYLRLVGQGAEIWNSRAHFLAVASQMMRRILVDHARARLREKRRGSSTRVTLSGAEDQAAVLQAEVLDVDRALTRLAEIDERKARLVEMRFFGGLTMEETAAALELSMTTAERDWRFARAFLIHELTGN
jgi:RNA polymerase sigma-70 factor, ECF subfamily